ncbi:MAG: adenylate/guanylate cyclase domain-containing protein [Myxococcota bacterium]|nr:adenylate/guanylate cyclase domain-containing protein [Myxococcota bacterium]
MQRWWLIAVAAVLVWPTGCAERYAAPLTEGRDLRLTILHTTDIHSRLLPYDMQVLAGDAKLGLEQANGPFGGIARVAHVIKRERGRAARSIHVDSGDCFQGAPIFNAFLGDLHLARKKLAHAHEQSELLLLNILPASIAQRLKTHHEVTIADDYPEASVLFADLVGFTSLSSRQTASETVVMLNGIFSAFDVAVVAHGLEKIKTIGDSYMVASGVPVRRRDHVTQLLALALTMQRLLAVHNMRHGYDLELRIGVHTGPLTAGVIGSRKFTYDIWGDTVNVASRMESTGISGRIQVSEAVTRAAAGHFEFEDRGLVEIKGKGEMQTFLVVPPA